MPSPVGEQVLAIFAKLYDVERDAKDLDVQHRWRVRQDKATLIAGALHMRLTAKRQKLPPGSATATAIYCSLNRCAAPVRYFDDGRLPADNNCVESQIRPVAIGRCNWLFARRPRAGKRAAAGMSLIHLAELNGHDPYAYP